MVKLAPDVSRDAATLATLMVDGHDGSRIPLGKLARIEPAFGLGTVKREAVALALVAVVLLLYLALGSLSEARVILATLPSAFVGGIVALLVAGESWGVSSLVGLIGLFGI